MIIRHVTEEDLDRALVKVNAVFGGNVSWRGIQPTNSARTTWRVTLKVKSSKGSGARRSWQGRRIPYACWHVHGVFFDALPEAAVIRLGREGIHRPGDPWKDFSIGSMMNPLMMSEACDCGGRDTRVGLMQGRVKMIRQKDLTADCWSVQLWGLEACGTCEFKDTDECGGRAILDKMKSGDFPKTGLPSANNPENNT